MNIRSIVFLQKPVPERQEYPNVELQPFPVVFYHPLDGGRHHTMYDEYVHIVKMTLPNLSLSIAQAKGEPLWLRAQDYPDVAPRQSHPHELSK
ncbi:MAG TPA: hypothetical protein EYO33_19060 [Phycisphaerales bacterium]|nr:hypothetical protein [Phycisphaerales bacterium]